MSIKGKENMEVVVYDILDDGRPVKKIAMKHAEILTGTFRDFVGRVNDKGTLVRKMTIAVPLSLVDTLKENGIPVGRWVPDGTPDDEMDEFDALVTVKINYSFFKKPVIEVKYGEDGEAIELPEDTVKELQNAHIDDALIIGRVYNGTFMNKPYTSIYLDQASLVLRKEEPPKIEQDMLDSFGFGPKEELPFD